MKKYTLSEADNDRVRKAVRQAESKTSGEIVTAIIDESSDYAFFELMASLLGGVAFYLISLIFYGNISQWLQSLFWSYSDIYPTFFIGITTALFIGLLYVAANIDGVDRIIVPGRIIDKRVKRRALLFFAESGLFDTKDRTGVLIFISLREKRVELIADKGINSMVPQDAWSHVVDNLIGRLKENKIIDGLVDAVGTCGEMLIEHFPIAEDDENELSNHVFILED